MATKRFSHLVKRGVAQLAAGLLAFRIRGPAAVQADHGDDGNLVASRGVQLHPVQSERAITVQHQHLLFRLGDLGAQSEREPNAHGPEHARVQAVARHKRRDRLAAVVQNLLAIDHQDGVTIEKVAHLLAQAQRVNGLLVGAHGCLGLHPFGLFDTGQMLAPP